MPSHKLAFLAVTFACVCAAAAGGYLAMRQNQASSAIAASAPSATATPGGPAQVAAPAPDRSENASRVGGRTSTTAKSSTASANSAAAPASTVAKNMPAPASGHATRQAAPPLSAPAQQPEPPPVTPPTTVPDAPVPTPQQDDIRTPEPPRTIEPAAAREKTFDELVVSADSVVGVQLEKEISSEKAKVEDVVDAQVIRDVRVGSHVAIPSGAHLLGSVTVVERGGKFKERARLGIRFNTLVLADGTKIPISTETIYRTGDPPANGSAAKIGGGAVVGTILGGILGGAKGAAIGAAAGAGGGAAVTAAGDRSVVTFPAGMQMTARFAAPVTITVEEDR